MGGPVTITPDQPPTAGPVTITPDAPSGWDAVKQSRHFGDPAAMAADYAKSGQMTLGGGGLQNVASEEGPSLLRMLYNHPKVKPIVDAALEEATHIPGNKTLKAAWQSFGEPVKNFLSKGAGGGTQVVEGTEGAAENAAGASEPGPTPPPTRGALAQGMQAALNSPSRTLPGQNPPEVIQPPAPQSAAPIPSRRGLALRAAPRGAELGDLPTPKAAPASQTGEALGQIPQRGSIARGMQEQPSTIKRGSLKQIMDQLQNQVGEGLGASPPPNPKAPIYQRGSIAKGMEEAPPSDIPEGHTPVNSSALRSYKYDPDKQEFEVWPTSGDTAYRYGDVSPDDAQAFEQAESKGKAFQQIKNTGTLVAKRVNGKWVSVKPDVPRGAISQQMSK